MEKFGDAVMPRTAEWDARWWSPIINAEHLQMRETAGMIDLTPFAIFDIVGPGALGVVQTCAVRQMDVAIGKVIYTPVLTPAGRVPLRPDDHATGSEPFPRRHRWCPTGCRTESGSPITCPPMGRRSCRI